MRYYLNPSVPGIAGEHRQRRVNYVKKRVQTGTERVFVPTEITFTGKPPDYYQMTEGHWADVPVFETREVPEVDEIRWIEVDDPTANALIALLMDGYEAFENPDGLSPLVDYDTRW